MIALGLLPFFYALVLPEPFYYEDLPFRVCGVGTTSIDNCQPNDDTHAFQPGDVVPFIAERCADDRFANGAELPYVVSRNLVRVDTGTRIILPSLSSDVPVGGCPQVAITFANQLPDTIPPGRYYLEGVATVYGRFRTVNAYYQTQSFLVVNNGQLETLRFGQRGRFVLTEVEFGIN